MMPLFVNKKLNANWKPYPIQNVHLDISSVKIVGKTEKCFVKIVR